MKWLDEIKEREKKATPKYTTFHPNLRFCANDIIGEDCCPEEPFVIAQMNRHMDRWKEDADFIAHSRTAIPRLVKALEIAIETMKYSIGPTRDVKEPKIRAALEEIEALGDEK